MVMNNIGIVQNRYMDRNGQPHNEYYFFSANNIRLGGVLLPSNSQYMEDAKTLNIITKALALRWGAISQPRKRK